MSGAIDRKSASPTLDVFRRYVTDFVNRHDFTVIEAFMAEDYTLSTSGVTVSGRDGAYAAAVARQMAQFPGLMFTPHELILVGNRIGIRFTEHGASIRHQGAVAAWPSIAIYELRDGRLARCSIEQDYMSRRRQLDMGTPTPVDPPAIAPWDVTPLDHDPEAERAVRDWLGAGDLLAATAVEIDDVAATGEAQRIVDGGTIEILELLAGGGKVAFHAVQTGRLAADFAALTGRPAGEAVTIHLSGLVQTTSGRVVGGHVIRDRWGLYRRLAEA